jgi:hypothetical protein
MKIVLYAAAPPPFALSANHPTANETIHRQLGHEVPIVIDTGASWSVTPCIQDYMSEIEEACETLQSLHGTINVSGSGIVEWKIQDRYGILKTIRNRALMYQPPEYDCSHLRLTSMKIKEEVCCANQTVLS